MTKEELFKDLWNTASNSCDTPYKQWVRQGFNWMYGWHECEVESMKNEIKYLKDEIKYLNGLISICWICDKKINKCKCDESR